jgi:HK97 family phage major capsid protein
LLFGRAVFTWEDMRATVSTSPQAPNRILFGDFAAGHGLTEIGPMTILRDPYSTKGKTVFYLAQRSAFFYF